MTTIDNLLVQIINHPSNLLETIFAPRDRSILQSLSVGVNSNNFITENQSKLLVKILRENQKKLVNFDPEISSLLENPTWSKTFRKIDQVKKFYISEHPADDKTLVIEFTFSSQIRKILTNLQKSVEGLIQVNSGKMFTADLSEKNIVLLVDTLRPLGFTISDDILSYYETIKSWSESDTKRQFFITSITNQNFQKQITDDLGVTTPIDEKVIADRGMRYQYFTETPEKNGENLPEILAFRKKTKIWIDSNQHSLTNLISALVELKRLPVMVVFDNYNTASTLENLKKLDKSLEENGVTTGVGIYFRFPNDELGKEFNQYIAHRQFNSQLDESTKVVGVQNGKIPKFMISSQWKPMSVISLGTSLRNSKTAVYSNCSDLVITYSDTQPLLESRDIWL